MAVANRKPLFVGQPKTTATDIPATANTNRDGTGTITTVYTASSPTSVSGYLAEVVTAVAKTTTTAGYLNLFYKPSGGAFYLLTQLPVTALTPSATVAAFEGAFAGVAFPIRMASGDSLGVAPTKAETFTVIVQGGALDNLDTAPVTQ